MGERDVNSTRIRDLLGTGQVKEAAELLGRPFSVRGRIAEGMKRGREMGFPTANLAPDNEMLPLPGVYMCAVRFLDDGEPRRGEVIPAVTNLGYRPTFDDSRSLIAESHLMDFSGDLYGRAIDLDFLERLRPEQKFESMEDLKAQIGRDVDSARSWLDEHPDEIPTRDESSR
jgi:riboflavin kinase/FMN adenylyltransferase